MEKQLTEKGKEINAYMQEHQIQVRGGGGQGGDAGDDKKEGGADKKDESKAAAGAGVLVSPSSAS